MFSNLSKLHLESPLTHRFLGLTSGILDSADLRTVQESLFSKHCGWLWCNVCRRDLESHFSSELILAFEPYLCIVHNFLSTNLFSSLDDWVMVMPPGERQNLKRESFGEIWVSDHFWKWILIIFSDAYKNWVTIA